MLCSMYMRCILLYPISSKDFQYSSMITSYFLYLEIEKLRGKLLYLHGYKNYSWLVLFGILSLKLYAVFKYKFLASVKGVVFKESFLL